MPFSSSGNPLVHTIDSDKLETQIEIHKEANQSLSSNDLLKLMSQKPRINERVAVGEQLQL